MERTTADLTEIEQVQAEHVAEARSTALSTGIPSLHEHNARSPFSRLEDTFSGPIEWDLDSLIWNAQILEEDHPTVDAILDAYGPVEEGALRQSLIARAAVMTAWYPILYPNPNAERLAKLNRRIEWLEKNAA